MIRLKSTWLAYMAAIVMSVASLAVLAEDEMKPFMLASTSTGNIADKLDGVKSALSGKGFELSVNTHPIRQHISSSLPTMR